MAEEMYGMKTPAYDSPSSIRRDVSGYVASTQFEICKTHRYIDLKILDAKQLLPVLEEAEKILGNLEGIRYSYFSMRKPGIDRLIHPDHVCQFRPMERVVLWLTQTNRSMSVY